MKKSRVVRGWFNLNEAAQYMGVSINTLKRLIKAQPDFPVIRFSKHLMRVKRQDIDNWLVKFADNQLKKSLLEQENPTANPL